MTNLFKRNKTYYIRLSLNDNLKIYFGNKTEYVKSLNTNNINDARLIAKYLISKFNYIKRSFKMFSEKEIKHYIDEFKKTNFDNIINRNSHLSIDEINSLIFDLNKEVDIYDEIIEKEFYSLLELINLDDTKELEFGLDVESAKKFKKHIIQIKINALNEVKKNIQNKVDITSTKVISEVSIVPDTFVTIEDAIIEWLNTRDGISKNQKYMSERDVNDFLDYCKNIDIKYIQNLKHKDLIDYRVYLKDTNPKSKIGTLNNALTNIITFLNYCHDKAHYINKITKGVKFPLTKRDKIEQKRNPYSNEEYKKLLDNIDLIKFTPKKMKPTKYFNEYEIIIKIGAYTGARENEICQLTKKDILKDENDIDYINFRIDFDDDKTLKTISSIRKVPIHSELETDLFNYIKSIKTNKLFTIKSNYFSISFGIFKTTLGFDDKHVFHSFRNTLQNKLKQKKVEFEMINEIAGHGSEDENKITNDYTNPYELHILKEAIEKISYLK
jgi:integrase